MLAPRMFMVTGGLWQTWQCGRFTGDRALGQTGALPVQGLA